MIREDPRNRNLLFAGTENGLYASWNGGDRWVSVRNNMPAVPVRDLQIHPRNNDVIVATHGRGIYILDDATPLQRLADATATDAFLFDPPMATRWITATRDGDLGSRVWVGQNPPTGAMLSYYLKAEAKAPLTITISDATGRAVRQLRNLPRDSGVSRVTWDLRFEGAQPPVDPQAAPPAAGPAGGPAGAAGGGVGGGGGGGGFGFGAGAGPFVLPGEYTVTLRAGDKSLTTKIQVRTDPRAEVTLAELKAQQDVAMALRDLAIRANTMVEQADGMTRQLTAVNQTLRAGGPAGGRGSRDSAAAAVQSAATSALQAVGAAQDRLKTFRDEKLNRPLQGLGYRQYPRLREEIQSLSGAVSRALERPTDPQIVRLRELTDETTALEGELAVIVATEIARVNQLLAGTPHVVTSPARRPTP